MKFTVALIIMAIVSYLLGYWGGWKARGQHDSDLVEAARQGLLDLIEEELPDDDTQE